MLGRSRESNSCVWLKRQGKGFSGSSCDGHTYEGQCEEHSQACQMCGRKLDPVPRSLPDHEEGDEEELSVDR